MICREANNTMGSSTLPEQNKKRYFAALDGWRFWAALIIVLHHSIRQPYFVQKIGPVFWLYTAAMTFFFMLSGFVAAASAKDKQWDFSSTLNYYAARLIRIWPPHVLALLVLLILWSIPRRTFFIETFSANLFLLQSWFPTQNFYFSYNGPSWYLSTLMALYLMMPLFMRYFKTCFSLSLLLPLLLCFVVPKSHKEYFFYISPFANMFKFLCGIIVYKLVSYIYMNLDPIHQKTFQANGSSSGLVWKLQYPLWLFLLRIGSQLLWLHFQNNILIRELVFGSYIKVVPGSRIIF